MKTTLLLFLTLTVGGADVPVKKQQRSLARFLFHIPLMVEGSNRTVFLFYPGNTKTTWHCKRRKQKVGVVRPRNQEAFRPLTE